MKIWELYQSKEMGLLIYRSGATASDSNEVKINNVTAAASDKLLRLTQVEGDVQADADA